jgi:GNAT superfamily N-acetyltransferase
MRVIFKGYEARDKNACLSLFDENCPEYFAPNERTDFENFLDSDPDEYQLCITDNKIVGVFGVMPDVDNSCSIVWIMISAAAQGKGVGTQMMQYALDRAKLPNVNKIYIATSHVAFKFFEKFGATIISKTKNGWGPDMHRIDMVIKL